MRQLSPRRQSPSARMSPMEGALQRCRTSPPPQSGASRSPQQRPLFDALMPPERSEERSASVVFRDDDALSTMTSRSVVSRAATTTSRRDGMPALLAGGGDRDSIHRTMFSQLQQLPKPHSHGLLVGAWRLLVGRNSFLNSVADDSDEEMASSTMRTPTVKFSFDSPKEDAASPTAKTNPLKASASDAGDPRGADELNTDDVDDHNTTIFVPLPVILVILAVFLYCCVVVFWFPSSRPYNKGYVSLWSGGRLESVEAAMPFVACAFYTLALAYANALSITFLRVEKQHVMDKRFVRQLRGKSITFGSKQAVRMLEQVNDDGQHVVSRKVVEKLKLGQRDQVPADVYARYICSLASIKAQRQLRNDVSTAVMIIVAPLLVSIAPWLPRLAAGGAIWAQAEVEEIAISILGPVLTFLCLNSIGSMLQTHAQTLSYHRERVARVACALQDPLQCRSLKSWPTIPFDTILNVTLWNRVRWALSFPPNALHQWGKFVFDASFVVVVGFFSIVALTSIFSKPAVVFDGSMALMLALLLTYVPAALFVLYLAFDATSLEAGNRDVLCRILLRISKDVINSNVAPEQRYVQSHKSEELRHAIRDVTSSVTDQLHPVRFLVLRASFATQLLPSL